MEESEIPRLSKRFSDTNKDKISSSGEVDYKNKAGTAWSHNFLNQKPWHPLSYPNQRRKWIAEQTHAQRDRRAEEVAREFSQEQEFFRQTALASKKEKEKMETIKAVSFMYVRPPGYNAESAKAAEISDEKKKLNPSSTTESTSAPLAIPENKQDDVETKKKSRPKDVFGRALPTEEEFDVLKNAPRFETGAPARAKPFAVEIRNVKCVRCGTYGHQSGDRECTLKNAIMPNDENRLKRDDPLTTITAQADFAEPLKWELKQRPGMSPPRGGFTPDDPNQQIVAEDIFDEYGGFLGGDGIPSLLLNPFKEKKAKKHSGKKSKHKRHSSTKDKVHHMIDSSMSQGVNVDLEMKVPTSSRKHKEIHHHKRRRRPPSDSSSSDEMRTSTLIKHKEKCHHSRRWATSSNSESDHEMIISSDKKHERIHGSKRVNRLSPSLNSEMRKTLSKRHRDKYHYRRAWLPSVFDSDGERRMSSDKKPRKYHDSGRWSPSSAFDSDSERRTSLSKKDEERNHHRQSPYSNSDSAHEMRTRMSTKHEHHDKRRISSSRKHRKERHHGRRN
ncbi:hypothetical protein ZOSMA_49G01150 [Zostera marina]|uniref:CBF1-interacting co-repressor CIR N-terminal domain-containing protein n=1 Tax=Zostera marina TaxID=29655 RepID=A0A0K9NYZ5_ZOSMR|nr:hypothetical protein ZOSMA_49G01150 [Zostera marina]